MSITERAKYIGPSILISIVSSLQVPDLNACSWEGVKFPEDVEIEADLAALSVGRHKTGER